MLRLRTAAIFGSLSLSVYFFVLVAGVILLGQSPVVNALVTPMSMLEELFNNGFDQSQVSCDLMSVFSLWLAFVCVIDLSLIASTIDFRHSARSVAAFGYAKRLLTGGRANVSW
jgi:hypothetical protein